MASRLAARAVQTCSGVIAIQILDVTLCCARPISPLVYLVVIIVSIIAIYCLLIRFILSFSYERPSEWRPPGLSIILTISSLGSLLVLFADLFRWAGIKGDIETNNLGDCLYFSIITMTTVGYGDFHPYNPLGRVIASVEALSGYVILGVLIASLANMLHTKQTITKRSNLNLSELRSAVETPPQEEDIRHPQS